MKEIKFRALCNGVWVYPICIDFEMKLAKGVKDTDKWFPYTVISQWTGFVDKNDNKIYEDDIISIEYYDTYVCKKRRYPVMQVIWLGYQWISKNEKYECEEAMETGVLTFSIFDRSDDYDNYKENLIIEVIGNVHQNPELLT